jgi:hypothetical protein
MACVSALLLLTCVMPCGATQELTAPTPIGKEERVPIAKLLAREILPETHPVLAEASQGRTVFDLKSDAAQSKPRPQLCFLGSAVGQFADPLRVLGHAREYTVPQLLVPLAFLDSAREDARCGFAILEPVLGKDSVRFLGLKTLSLGEDDEHALLCGTLRGVQDLHGGVEKGTGDGLIEIELERYVVNRRIRADDPPVFKETYVVDLAGAHPEILEEGRSEEVDALPDGLPVHVEYSGTHDVRIVCHREIEDPEEEVELPPELAMIRDKLPDIRFVSVEHEGSTTSVSAVAPTHYVTAQFIRELEGQGSWYIVPQSIKRKDDGTHFLVSYSPKSEQPEPEE